MKTAEPSFLEQLIDPLSGLLSPEVARRIVNWKFDRRTQSRIDQLARRCNEGRLSEAERREYETCVHAIDFIAVLQAKARLLLRQSGED